MTRVLVIGSPVMPAGRLDEPVTARRAGRQKQGVGKEWLVFTSSPCATRA